MTQYSIDQFSKITGLNKILIRTWENRYNFLKPKRTSTNIRYYNDKMLTKGIKYAILVNDGYKISKLIKYEDQQINDLIEEKLKLSESVDTKYNIYIICKTEEDFLEKCNEINKKYKSKICHIQWIPAEYLKLTQCNKQLLNDLNTRWNTKKDKILAKLGTIAAHRKALLAIYMNKTDNNIILEADAEYFLIL